MDYKRRVLYLVVGLILFCSTAFSATAYKMRFNNQTGRGDWVVADESIYADGIEGTIIKSTGEAGGTKFLREDGDGTSSWQAVPAGGGVALGDLTDVGDSTATSGNLLVADGTNWDSVASSGDVVIANTGAATIQANSVDGAMVALGSEAAGDVMYYDGTNWKILVSGTSGQVLQTNGVAAPSWVTNSGSGATELAGLLDVGDSTATSGNFLVADGTNFDSVAMSGDVNISNTGAATIQANSVDGTNIAFGSDVQGDIAYYDGTNWTPLTAGTSGQFLKTQGSSDVPTWAASTGGASELSGLSDVGDSTATSGYLLIADGTNWDSVPMSDDATITSAGVISVVDLTCTNCVEDGDVDDDITLTNLSQVSDADTATQTLTNKTMDSSTNDIHADSVHEELRNETGSTINRGDAVYISGYNVGQERALVTLADADSSATMPSVALVEDSSIANNATGEFVEVGTLSGFDTSSFSVGDQLYVSGSGTTGNTLTTTKPTGTALVQKVAEVLRSHATLGIVKVFGAGRTNDLPNLANTKLWIGDSSGVPQEFTLSSDVTITAGGVVTIANNAVDGTNIAFGSDARGDITYYDGTNWTPLAAGTSGRFLKTQGANNKPTWSAGASGATNLAGLSDVGDSTATTGFLLVADGTNFDSVDMTGDVDIDNAGATTIQSNAVQGTMIAFGSDVQGDITYYDGTNWTPLAAGTDGQFLKTQGASDIPTWAASTGGASELGSLSDVGDSTATDGHILVADGTNFDSVNVTGDVELTNAGVTTIQANAVDGTMIAYGSDAQGDIMYYDGTNWTPLAAGTSGQYLQSQGSSDIPTWTNSCQIFERGVYSSKIGGADITTAAVIDGGQRPWLALFDDSAVEEVTYQFVVPECYNTNNSITVDQWFSMADAQTGDLDVEFECKWMCATAEDNEDFNTDAYDTQQICDVDLDTNQPAGYPKKCSITFTSTQADEVAPDDICRYHCERDVATTNDASGDVELLHIIGAGP